MRALWWTALAAFAVVAAFVVGVRTGANASGSHNTQLTRTLVHLQQQQVKCPTAPAPMCEPNDDTCPEDLAALQVISEALAIPPNAWPQREYAASELPDNWGRAIDEVFASCDIPGELVLTDCSEPPCVAAMRGATGGEIHDALGRCPAYLEAFPESEVGPAPMSVQCEDGSASIMLLLTTFTSDQREAYFEDLGIQELMGSDFTDLNGLSALGEGYRILGRRADALSRLWSCE